ncbi:MAG: TetR/AcrR family transcriptional regulator [Thermoleophilaceae bacterium]
MTSVGGRGKTRWGDREQRRKDILAAARAELEQHGYVGFRMRDLAKGAGVSPGALYSYFATKEDIFAALYAERLGKLQAEVAVMCAEADDLHDLLVALGKAYLPVYAEYGEHFDLWALTQSAQDGEQIPERALPLVETAGQTLAAVGAAVRRLGALDAFEEADQGYVMPFLWITVTGLAGHFTGSRHLMHPYTFDELAGFAADVMVAALRSGRVPR